MASTNGLGSPILGPMRFAFVPRWARRGARLAISPDARWDWASERRRRRLRAPPDLPGGEIRKVMVICHGNICRSAFAGPLLARLRPDLEVRSAGFGATPGKRAEPEAIRSAHRYEVELESHRARRLDAEGAGWADLILGMEGHHTRQVARHGPIALAKARLLGDWLDAPPYAIRDPWGREDAVFDATFARIAAALERLAAQLPARTGGAS